MEHCHPRTPPARPLVLIADGHDDTRELYAVALGPFGFDTDTVDDATHGFDRALTTHPDVIVTELSLPGLDGWSLVGDLKRNPRTRDIPVVVLTARIEPSVRERAEREGCAALLLKPCLPEQLAGALRELLNQGRLHQQTEDVVGRTTEAARRSLVDTNTAQRARHSDANEVAQRAHELYEARGAQPGADLDDCPQAERELGGKSDRESPEA
jgi:CheY-like chemotaxis protein